MVLAQIILDIVLRFNNRSIYKQGKKDDYLTLVMN